MTTWATKDAVDVEVKRGFTRSQKVFGRYASSWREQPPRSSLCVTCEGACRLAGFRVDATWSKTRSTFEKSTTSSGCHLCVIIAHAFDRKAIAAFQTMRPDEEITLHFSYRSLTKNPSSKLGFEERYRVPLSGYFDDDGPDEMWLAIESQEPFAPGGDIRIDLRMQPFFTGR